jgi:hypothetical protein
MRKIWANQHHDSKNRYPKAKAIILKKISFNQGLLPQFSKIKRLNVRRVMALPLLLLFTELHHITTLSLKAHFPSKVIHTTQSLILN